MDDFQSAPLNGKLHSCNGHRSCRFPVWASDFSIRSFFSFFKKETYVSRRYANK